MKWICILYYLCMFHCFWNRVGRQNLEWIIYCFYGNLIQYRLFDWFSIEIWFVMNIWTLCFVLGYYRTFSMKNRIMTFFSSSALSTSQYAVMCIYSLKNVCFYNIWCSVSFCWYIKRYLIVFFYVFIVVAFYEGDNGSWFLNL